MISKSLAFFSLLGSQFLGSVGHLLGGWIVQQLTSLQLHYMGIGHILIVKVHRGGRGTDTPLKQFS